MKRIAGKISLICALLFFPCAVQADTIRIKADEWCPFNCLPDTDSKGYMIELAEKIFEKAGHRIKYEVMPWSRSIDHARKGKIEAIAGATKGEVPTFIFYVQHGRPGTCDCAQNLHGIGGDHGRQGRRCG